MQLSSGLHFVGQPCMSLLSVCRFPCCKQSLEGLCPHGSCHAEWPKTKTVVEQLVLTTYTLTQRHPLCASGIPNALPHPDSQAFNAECKNNANGQMMQPTALRCHWSTPPGRDTAHLYRCPCVWCPVCSQVNRLQCSATGVEHNRCPCVWCRVFGAVCFHVDQLQCSATGFSHDLLL